jgi:hypothetical protein
MHRVDSTVDSVRVRPTVLWSPLHAAAERGALDEVKRLLAQGCDVDAKDLFQRTPLHYATAREHTAVVACLIQGGSDVEAKDDDGLTPLHDAASKGNTAIVAWLIQQGDANVDAKDDAHWTPLHNSSVAGHAAVVQLLLDAGAAAGAKDVEGKTPRDVAIKCTKDDVVLVLDRFAAAAAAAAAASAASIATAAAAAAAAPTTTAATSARRRVHIPKAIILPGEIEHDPKQQAAAVIATNKGVVAESASIVAQVAAAAAASDASATIAAAYAPALLTNAAAAARAELAAAQTAAAELRAEPSTASPPSSPSSPSVAASDAPRPLRANAIDLSKSTRLGRGANGEVVSALYMGAPVAVKWMTVASRKQKAVAMREYTRAAAARHPNIAQLYGFVDIPSPDGVGDKIGLVMERARGGTLHSLLHDRDVALTLYDRVVILRQIASAMRYLHACEPPISHGDLKPLNVLMTLFATPKLTDFGFSMSRPSGASRTQTRGGTLLYKWVAWRGVAWRGVAWRGVAWRGMAWRVRACVRAYACASSFARRPVLQSGALVSSRLFPPTSIRLACWRGRRYVARSRGRMCV